MNVSAEKMKAAAAAVKMIEDGMIVGLGSGSTSAEMIRLLGKEVQNGLSIKGVPSSDAAAALAREMNIELLNMDEIDRIDLNIDGADEFDPQLRLIKGGGGALLREKIVAYNSDINVIIADSGKKVEQLGAFKLPIEIIPFAYVQILRELKSWGLKPQMREQAGSNYYTDEQNLIIDADISGYHDVEELESRLINIPGVVETGLFLHTTSMVLMGSNEKVIHFTRSGQ